MCSDSYILSQIYRSCVKFMLHNSEALFNFPTTMINTDDLLRRIIQICCNRIESVIMFLIPYSILIKLIYIFIRNFTLVCHGHFLDKTLVIALPCAFALFF